MEYDNDGQPITDKAGYRKALESSDSKAFQLKALKVEDKEGSFEAVFATLNVIDHDGDKILSGAVGKQKVRISAYGHGSWPQMGGSLPVGRGETAEIGDDAVVKGRFFVDTDHGRNTYLTVKQLDDLNEFSFSLDKGLESVLVEESGRGRWGIGRDIAKVGITEISPVLRGAGIDTRLRAIKGLLNGTPDGMLSKMTLEQQVMETVKAVRGTADRLKAVAEIRTGDGREVGEPFMAKLGETIKAASELHCMLVEFDAKHRGVKAVELDGVEAELMLIQAQMAERYILSV